MSDSIVLVRFSDGEIRCAYYFGSIDSVVPVLFPLDQANEVLAGGMDAMMEILADVEPTEPAQETESVEVWLPTMPEVWWEGIASRDPAFLWEGIAPFGFPNSMDGEGAAELHEGTPEWVPQSWL